MPRTKGATNRNVTRFIVPNQFDDCPTYLRMWNIANVAANLYEIKPDMAERYLSVNLLETERNLFKEVVDKVMQYRHPQFGMRVGDDVRKVWIGRKGR